MDSECKVMLHIQSVSKTRTEKKRHRFMTCKANRSETNFQKVLVGKHGHIRTNDISGTILISELPDYVNIDGCDWHGALSILYHLNPYHEAITKNGVFYFMIPPEEEHVSIDDIVFSVFFHHVYNIYLLRDPWSTPPFRTSFVDKIAFLGKLLITDLDETFDTVLEDIQTCLKKYPYKSWHEIKDRILNFEIKPAKQIVFSNTYRLEKIGNVFEKPEDILAYLDGTTVLPPKLIEKQEGSLKNYICEILLKKIDLQTIYLQTGVMPIETNWVKELDFFLFKLDRDGLRS